MKKCILIIGCILICQNFMFAQIKDSFAIYTILEKIQIYLQNSQPDSAIHFAQMGLEQSETAKDRAGAADCLHLLGKAYFQKSEIPSALRYYLQALKVKESNRSEKELSALHFELAAVYEYWSVYEKSIQHYQYVLEDHKEEDLSLRIKALAGMARNHYLNKKLQEAIEYYQELQLIFESENNQMGVVETRQEIIKIYKEQGAYEKAVIENLKVLFFYEQQQDTTETIVALNNLGVLQRQLNDLDNALNYFIRSADLQALTQNLTNPTTLTNIGILYQNQRAYQKSLRYLFEAEKNIKAQKTLNVPELSGIHNLISIVYLSMNDINNAYFHNEQAIDLATTINDKNLEQLGYKTRSDIYEQFNDYEQALLYFQKHTEIKDSLISKQQTAREQNLLKQFSAEQTEKEISLIAIDREVEDLKYQQDLLENDKLRQEQALQQSLLVQERLEKDQAEKALQITQQAFEQEQAQQQLALTQQQLLAEQKDRQITSLENEQTQQALEIAKRELEAEQKDKAIAQSEKAKVELQLSLQEKDFELTNQRETGLRNFTIAGLILSLIILGLLFRTSRIRNRANKVLGQQKQELETALSDLHETQSQLLQSDKMASLGQLTAGVAHEINNPINFITTSVDALKYDVQDLQAILKGVLELKSGEAESVNKLIQLREDLDVPFLKDEVSELIENIEIGANRTHGIVTALRTYSRDTSEKFILADLHEGIDSSLIILNHKKGDLIKVKKQYAKLPQVSCMASRLNQVFLNIIDNAIQAIESEGEIMISTAFNKAEQKVSIRIKDTGKGMGEHSIKNAFNPFYTTKEVGKGTGLGLYVSYNIIQQHHGTIEINSEEGKGTEFVIVLPVDQGEKAD